MSVPKQRRKSGAPVTPSVSESLRNDERFRLLVEHSGDLLCEIDTEGRFRYLSPNHGAILGYETGELLNQIAFDWVNPDDLPAVLVAFEKRAQSVTFRFRHKNGSWRWLECSARSFRTDEGEERGVLLSRDITERKGVDERFRQLSQAVEQSPAAVIITDTTGEIQYVNPKFTEITGYAEMDVIGRTPNILKSGKQSPKLYKHLWKSITSGKIWRGEFFNKKKNGVLYWDSSSISPICDNSGKITHFVAVKEDITERKNAEERLREQAQFLDLARDAIIVKSREGEILFWNTGAENIYGWSAAEALGRSGLELNIAPGASSAPMEELLRNGAWHGEMSQRSKSGRVLVVDSRWTLLCDNAGNPKSVLSINTDITERKDLERQFLRAQRLESIGTLVSGVAHDLNNILAPILMGASLLHEESGREMMENIISTIERHTRRAADVVQQLLTFARGSEASHSTVAPQTFLHEMAEIARATFPKNIQIVEHIPEDLKPINANATQLHQVLLNLCVNARDAMPDGGTLVLSAENCYMDEQFSAMAFGGSPGAYVSLKVTDTGRGIPGEIIDKIFDPFFTTKEIGAGTGLGLATAHGIVKSHGGFLNVDSKPGNGTTFTAYLPAVTELNQKLNQPEENEPLPRGAGELVLLVDDEPGIIQIIDAMLRRNGYRVLTAADGVEAIALYAVNHKEIAIVFTDLIMPFLDGNALTRALRKINPQVKVIIASGHGNESHLAAVRRLGVNAFLAKPYSRQTLLTTLRNVLLKQSALANT